MIAQHERPADARDPYAALCQTCGVRRQPCNHPAAGPWWKPHPKRPKPITPPPPTKYAQP